MKKKEKEAIKKVLTLAKDYISEKYFSGICSLVLLLQKEGYCTYDEYILTLYYIRDHRPGWLSKHYDKSYKNSLYYWPEGKVEPRVKWINSVLKKL